MTSAVLRLACSWVASALRALRKACGSARVQHDVRHKVTQSGRSIRILGVIDIMNACHEVEMIGGMTMATVALGTAARSAKKRPRPNILHAPLCMVYK